MKTYELAISIEDGGKQYKVKLEVGAKNLVELEEKLNALTVLSKTLRHDDFISTAEIIGEKPELVKIIKELINEGEKLNESQLMLKLPKYVKRVLSVLKS